MIRVLLLADTHLGFDLPLRPRVERRRRGDDFFANFERALQPALGGQVDLVIHGGDLFFRSRVPPALVQLAFEPLLRVAKAGVPVCLVPGNHERSRIPMQLWVAHPNIHVFDEPRTIRYAVAGATIALAGFPFARRVRDVFDDLLERTLYRNVSADVYLLCIHQTVEGAQVGPSDYTFRSGPDIIAGWQIPGGFAAVAAGHIHRSQMLERDFRGRPLAAPVIYPGSIERTSFAERDEDKHYVILELDESGRLAGVDFVPLPARPMVGLTVSPNGLTPALMENYLRQRLAQLDPDAVVRLKVDEPVPAELGAILSAASLRRMAPDTMNVSLSVDQRARRAPLRSDGT